MSRPLFFLLILICFFSNKSVGQQPELSPELVDWYRQTLPLFQEVVTGGQYSDAPVNYLGSPFYESRKFGVGEIWVNGLRYSGVRLLYDTWSDEVLSFHPVYNQKVLIKAEKIEKFVFADGATFLRFDSNPGYGRHHHGFYQLIAEGYPKLLKKHYRNVESVNETGLITREFQVGEDYFFWFEGGFWKAGSKKESMLALGLSGKEVKGYFKGKGLVFKQDPENYLLELLRLKESIAGDFKGFPER